MSAVPPIRLLRRREMVFGDPIYPIAGVQCFHVLQSAGGWTIERSCITGRRRNEQETWLEATAIEDLWFTRLRELLAALQAAHEDSPCPLDFSLEQKIRLRPTATGYGYQSEFVTAVVTRTVQDTAWHVTIAVTEPGAERSMRLHGGQASHLHEVRQIIDHYVRRSAIAQAA
jgi:hypothetical protein